MYYREKVLLGLLQVFKNKLAKNRLHHLMMLHSQSQEEPSYHFIPDQNGCYSFQLEHDIQSLQKSELLTADEQTCTKATEDDYRSILTQKDRQSIKSLKLLYERKSDEELKKYIFQHYPFFAIRSSEAQQLLSPQELQTVDLFRPFNTKPKLHTIGYEGISLEEYLNKLIKNNVNVLCDVRSNPYSRKYGFSKQHLEEACAHLNIDYQHFPKLGIPKEMRQNIETPEDFEALFEDYREEILPKAEKDLQELLDLMKKKEKRIALTCYEKDVERCHRQYIVDALEKLPGFDYQISHL